MEAAHRYRLLIIFAALVLCLSVCFANAEQIHSAHATFMPAAQQAFLHDTVNTPATPTVSNNLLEQLTVEKPHRFWHGVSIARRKPGLIVNHPKDASYGVSSQSMQDANPAAEGMSQTE